MGASPQSLMALESKGTISTSCKILGNTPNQGRRAYKKLLASSCMKSRRVPMKRRTRRPPRHQASDHGFESRVQTLKWLIPSREPEGLEGLFRDTADYILALQRRVKAMQMMVDALEDGYSTTTSNE